MYVKTDRTEKNTDLQPGDLNRYIQVTPISLWMLLGVVGVFVTGLLAWGFYANLTVSVDAVALVKDGETVLYIPADQLDGLSFESEVEIEGETLLLQNLSSETHTAGEVLDETQLALAGLDMSRQVVASRLKTDLPDGVYSASVIQERVSPAGLLYGKTSPAGGEDARDGE